MARLYLVRHAQSANNVVWDGSPHQRGRHEDPEITELGHRQAAAVAEHFAHPHAEPPQRRHDPAGHSHFGLTHVYCSLMTRSVLTAEYIARACGLDLEAHPEIFEKWGIYNHDEDGNLVGLPGPGRDYFERRFPALKLPEDLDEGGWWNRPMEDEPGFVERVQRVVAEFSERLHGSDERVAIVVHGDFIDEFVNALTGAPRHGHNYRDGGGANWTFHNTSVSRVDFVDGTQNVVYLNRVHHLPNELVTW